MRVRASDCDPVLLHRLAKSTCSTSSPPSFIAKSRSEVDAETVVEGDDDKAEAEEEEEEEEEEEDGLCCNMRSAINPPMDSALGSCWPLTARRARKMSSRARSKDASSSGLSISCSGKSPKGFLAGGKGSGKLHLLNIGFKMVISLAHCRSTIVT